MASSAGAPRIEAAKAADPLHPAPVHRHHRSRQGRHDPDPPARGRRSEHGTWFDGSSIEGFTRIAESDQYLMPDMSTFSEIPWQPGSGTRGTARVICDVFTPRGEPFAGRPALRSSAARSNGRRSSATSSTPGPSSSSSCSGGARTGTIEPLPHDQAGYFDFSTDLAQEIRQDMVDALEAFGIRVEAAHHEVAAGQHEIDFEYSDALRTADNAITFKFALKAIAQQHGLYATFMPKPIHGINGSGMHTHQSLWSIAEQRNAFADAVEPVRPVRRRAFLHGRDPRPRPRHDRGARAAGELVQAARARVRGADLPDVGPDQPSALIRVPMVSPGKSVEGTRAEVRCPDPSSNTYLAFAAMIAAGLDGVRRACRSRIRSRRSLFEMDAATIAAKGIRELPGTLGEALDELEADDVIRDALGDHVFRHYVEAKRAEWDEYRNAGLGLGSLALPRSVLERVSSRHGYTHAHRHRRSSSSAAVSGSSARTTAIRWRRVPSSARNWAILGIVFGPIALRCSTSCPKGGKISDKGRGRGAGDARVGAPRPARRPLREAEQEEAPLIA